MKMNLNTQKNYDIILYAGFSFLLTFLLALKDVHILFFSKWPHLYSVVNTPRASWEEVYCYLPLYNNFSLDILPSEIYKLTFFPLITLISQAAVLKWLCFSNINVYLLFVHIVFPVISFWIIFLIFRRYVAVSWALMLAFFGITYYPNFSLFHYFSNLLSNPGQIIDTASLSPMEITRVPAPCFTFFLFILTFYISIKKHKLSNIRCYTVCALWSLHLYVYLFNFVSGILFWFLYSIYTQYIKDGRLDFRKIMPKLIGNTLVVFIVISPIIVKKLFFFTPLDIEIFQRMELVVFKTGFLVNTWGVIVSYILPLTVVIIITRIYCADYYELIYKFTPVFIMIFVEVFVSNIHIVLGKFFQPELYPKRIGNFFPRYLYYIPIIYFISSPYKKLFHGDFKNRIAGFVHSFFSRFIIKYRVLIAAISIILISIFSIISSVRYIKHFELIVAPRMIEVKKNFDALLSPVKGNDSIVVSEDIPVNLLIPVLTKRETLLVNAFSTYISGDEILNRLVLFAHILNWDKNNFLDFMMPSDTYKKFNSDNTFVLSDNILKKGFGYWLLNHRKHMSAKVLEEYQEKLLNTFERYNLEENIKKYKIKAVQSYGQINRLLPIESIYKGNETTLYILKDT